MVKAMVNLEGVEPSDYTGIYSSLPYPGKMGDWAKNCGGRELWVEGSQDWRDMLAGAQNMNAAVSGSATYFKVTYGGGAHCCWNTEYEPGVTWTKASNPDISQLVGTALPMNVWQWLLRQGDTSMPANAPAPPPSSKPATAPATPPPATPPPASPTVSAGADPTITLPVTTTTLKAAAAGPDGAKITKVVWQQSQGPVSAKIVSPSDLSTEITGLTKAGTYVFRITVTDNNGKQAASVVDVVAKAAAAPKTETPPTMSAGKGQKITLPTSATMLEGTAAGTDGAKIVTISWAQVGGPEKAKIASPASLKTEVSGLTEAGAYIFQLIVIDNNGKSADGSMTVTVEPDDTKAPPTVSAGPNLTVTLPTNSATLKGSATGHNGAVVNSYFWMFVTGPAWVKFSDEWALTTTVSGLVAGTYVFELSASDNKDETSTSMMTLVVKPKSGTAPATTGPTQETGNAALLPDPALVDPNAHGLVIYPNPVQGMLNLRLADSTTGRMVIKIFDANGRFIQGSVLEKGGISIESAIDVSKLSKGIYVMQLMSESGGMMTRKFVKL
jgi:hypothetical protein